MRARAHTHTHTHRSYNRTHTTPVPGTSIIGPNRIGEKEVDQSRGRHPENEIARLVADVLSGKARERTVAAALVAAASILAQN